jgi:predicted TPR repeat methyltransferase
MASSRPPSRRRRVAAAAAPPAELGPALGQAIDALRNERLDEAQRAFDALLARWPEQPDALHFLGVLRHSQGRAEEAIELIRRAIAQVPQAPGMWNNLGNVLTAAGRIDEALAAYERSVELAGEDAEGAGPLNNIALIHRKRGELPKAEASLRRALELEAEHAEAWYNLSRVLIDQGRIHEGLVANGHAITLWPRHLIARDQVLRALLMLGERDKAAEMYREWLAEDPGNPVVQHQLAACLGVDVPARASDAYVEQLFDTYADSFDRKLEALHYRAPGLVEQALRRALPQPDGSLDVVDLGCGTGLCGPLIRAWARTLAGCDLSVGMLRQADRRSVYDVLHKAELVHYLETQPAHFDLAVSADTLCYFGPLDAALRAAARALRPGGTMIFTVEALADGGGEPHRLQTNGRYIHARPYLQRALEDAGFAVAAIEPETLRMEAGLPVAGWLVTAERT